MAIGILFLRCISMPEVALPGRVSSLTIRSGHLHTSCAMQVVESFVNVGHQWLFHAMLLLLAYMNRGGLDEARLHSLLPWGAASLPIAFGADHVAYIP